MRTLLLAIFLFAACGVATADELIMVRVNRAFPETMTNLQEEIHAQGYTVSRVQRVDVGLTSSGYKTAEYRLVFFGKAQEIHSIATNHPDMIPYIPLTIVVIAEGDETLLLTANPLKLGEFFNAPDVQDQFRTWERDIRTILRRLSSQAE